MERHAGQGINQVSTRRLAIFLRVIFIGVLLLGSLVHWHWKASIISHLSVSLPSLPFTSPQEFLESPYQVQPCRGDHLSQVTTIGDSSLQTKFEAAPEGSLYNLMWDKKFEEKNKSLVKKIEDTIPIVHGGEVKSLFCSPITNFSLQCIYQNR